MFDLFGVVMISFLRSVWTWAATVSLIVLWLPFLAVVRLFDRDPALYHTGRRFRDLGALITRVNPFWNICISGRMPPDPRLPYVVVSNHQSQADIPIISRLPWEMKWVAKRELFHLPFVGWLMRLAGDIEVNRSDKRSRAMVLITAKEYLDKKCSVMFFPEGTRSRDGRVLPFTDGAFRLAIKAGAPVLPLAIDGTADALPKHDWRFSAGAPIRLKVLEPVETHGLTAADQERLREEVRSRIVRQLAQWRGVPPEAVDGLSASAASHPAD